MSIKVKIVGKVTRRFKEVRKNGKEEFCIVVSDCAPQYPNVLKLKAKDKESLACAEVGKTVSADVWIDGREWTPPDGKPMYFTDFKIAAISAVEEQQPKPAQEAAPGGEEAVDDLPF